MRLGESLGMAWRLPPRPCQVDPLGAGARFVSEMRRVRFPYLALRLTVRDGPKG